MDVEAVLILDKAINEGATSTKPDPRLTGTGKTIGYQNGPFKNNGPGGLPGGYDWRVWSGSGFGKRVAQSLSNMGAGYSAEVTDMGQYVSVRVSYHESATGRSVAKTYIIAFDDPRSGEGTIFTTSTKWRTIGNPDQAVNYIRSSINSYASSTKQV